LEQEDCERELANHGRLTGFTEQNRREVFLGGDRREGAAALVKVGPAIAGVEADDAMGLDAELDEGRGRDAREGHAGSTKAPMVYCPRGPETVMVQKKGGTGRIMPRKRTGLTA
jgi:hypothetical protein